MSFPGLNTEETKRRIEEDRRRKEELAKGRRGTSVAQAVREAEEAAKLVRDGIADEYE